MLRAAAPVDDRAPARRVRLPRLEEAHLFLLLAILIGMFSGLAVVCFRVAIEWSRLALLGPAIEPVFPRVVLVPLSPVSSWRRGRVRVPHGARQRRSPDEGGGLHLDGYIPFRTVIAKFLTCALAIGGGHSLGPEDPSLQIGAGLASLFGRRLQLSRDKLRLIAPVGAAAGLAAAFNSPITAVLFVIEEVIGTWSAGALGASSSRRSPRSSPSSGSSAESRSSACLPSRWRTRWSWSRMPRSASPAASLRWCSSKSATTLRPRLRGAAAVDAHPAAGGRRRNHRPGRHLVPAGDGRRLRARRRGDARPVRVAHARGARRPEDARDGALVRQRDTRGPVRAHLFTGAMLGGAVCGIARLVAPDVTGPIGAYALVGMGTLFAGILRAPMTSVFMMVEVSGNYSIVLPVMISNSIAYMISRRFQPTPIFEVLSHQDGVVLPSMEEQRETRPRNVEDAMRETTFVLDGGMTIGEARAIAGGAPDLALPVRLAGAIWAGISMNELEALDAGGHGGESLESALGPDTRVAAVHRDQPLDTALRLLRNRPLLPVVHRADRTRIEGVITLDDILAAYRE